LEFDKYLIAKETKLSPISEQVLFSGLSKGYLIFSILKNSYGRNNKVPL